MKILTTTLFLLVGVVATAQWTFWVEEFGAECNQGQLATDAIGTNGTWTITETGINQSSGNRWYISAMENNTGAGNCGEVCGTNQTLHISNQTVLGVEADQGAAYYEGLDGLCDLFPCGATDIRVESPTIDCFGYEDIRLDFVYLEGGNALDNATVWYFDGFDWMQLDDPPKTFSATCSPQGQWTNYTIYLPASASYNSNVKIGFRWVNNDDCNATDPSFAVDDIQISGNDEGGCLGDLNFDGQINASDLLIFLGGFGCLANCVADLDGNGTVDAIDLLIFLGVYGSSCP